jgi:hypothetical protein
MPSLANGFEEVKQTDGRRVAKIGRSHLKIIFSRTNRPEMIKFTLMLPE